MRWLIGLLVLLNLLLFLWTRIDPGEAPHEEAPPPEVGELRLWSEVQEQRRAERTPSSTDSQLLDREASEVVAEPAASALPENLAASDLNPAWPPAQTSTVASERDVVLPNAQTLGVAVEPERVPSEPPSASKFKGTAPSESAAPRVQGSIESTSMDTGENGHGVRAKRIAEVPVAEQSVTSDTKPVPAPTPSCGELRWFVDEATAAAVMKELAAQGVFAESSAEEYEEQTGYWVLVPPQPDVDAARAVRTELRDKGVEDLWLFTAGPMRNSISLGMFRGQARADRRADEIRALGFSVEVRPKLTEKTGYVIRYRADARSRAAAEAAAGGEYEVKHRMVVCP